MRRALSSLALAVVFVLFVTAPVAAAGMQRLFFEGTFQLMFTSELCGFPVFQTVSGWYLERVTVAADGTTTIKDVTPGTFSSVFFSTDEDGIPTGKSLVAHQAELTVTIIYLDGSVVSTNSGAHDRINLPGSGVIMGTIGHIYFSFDAVTGEETFSFAGTHEISPETLANLCEPLDPAA